MTTTDTGSLLRVTKGSATPEELAALVVVLLARTRATTRPRNEIRRHHPHWRRLERALGHRGPRSWRSETRPAARHTG
ncbi:acyl-CoA carboxylase epsilon subunit [Streptomyces benahoarensis]|uniref:Acyl-CoA carboxylase subunit epsilon n=1 Tax=Streptomyces benahoarensis TaxID=2595054 RepID=A0A553ZP93_9ACTN|nr:acyl-CoA carboxylase epsilon subunit [Streptomyces benahoarensis]TSB26787.1 acyl-CoA carboxylase subunit epsilon [Streptomyces benahoarensis]TSB43116.1 acyl-CoA carboxylase subunit epsilon [Streptomyces benahoarensis]